MLEWILASSLFISLLSLAGAFTFSLKEKVLQKLLIYMVAFSAGALLGGAFFHLLPEAVDLAGAGNSLIVFAYLLVGFLVFFAMERVLRWRHCHDGKCDVHAFSYLNLFGDGLHNFIDGLVIAAAFLTSFDLGLVTTFVIASHEIPQELGDFAVLVYGGFSKSKALFYNLVSALTAVLGALAGYFLASAMPSFSAVLLPFTAGGFVYIASSDLIPEIHKQQDARKSYGSFLFFLAGIGLMLVVKLYGGE